LWQKNPGSVDPIIAAHFNGTAGIRRDIEANTNMISLINADMDKKYGKIEDYIPKNSPNLTPGK
jgi:hypothetical protein